MSLFYNSRFHAFDHFSLDITVFCHLYIRKVFLLITTSFIINENITLSSYYYDDNDADIITSYY